MEILTMILIVIGLAMFEIISSLDNAIINAEVLSTMGQKARRWFLLWGFLFAVIIVRGLLPWVIIWITNPSLDFVGSLTATFSSDPLIKETIEQSTPILFIGGAIFLIFLFFHWLFLEHKNYGLKGEKFFHSQGVWFYAVISILLTVIVWFSLKKNPVMAFSAVIGSTAFFITHGFKQNAEEEEKRLVEGKSVKSDISKILYLEVIDATFSIDGVLGAFAFTLIIPLILIGNGIGAYVLRRFTVNNMDTVKKYKYLKNGAMYSILLLGIIMLAESFGAHIPTWITPIGTMIVICYFFWKSKKELDSPYAQNAV
ncbi:DUF475 domain-containing protein [Candidatus Woesearchaeota archaeon]|nr:DUF475 domain-containing protein [Candidatus Woesearchaeota archaeon]